MIKEYFHVLFKDNADYIDYSLDAKEFGRDTFNLDFVQTEDKIYVGLYKPFKRLYLHFASPSGSALELSIKQYIAGSFSSISFHDETKGFTRSGFIRLDNSDNWELSSIDGKSAYWLEIGLDSDVSLEIDGISEIFSEDHDLKEDYFEIHDFLPEGESSFILKHQAAKKDIIQDVRNRALKKRNNSQLEHIAQFDFLEPDNELRQASKYLTLHKIFLNINDNEEGIYSKMARKYEEKYLVAFNNTYLGLDQDNDGKADNVEKATVQTIKVIRV